MELQCTDLIDAEPASWRGVFGIGHLAVQQMVMAAFPESGRSNCWKEREMKGR
jgi:hypothetical protein